VDECKPLACGECCKTRTYDDGAAGDNVDITVTCGVVGRCRLTLSNLR